MANQLHKMGHPECALYITSKHLHSKLCEALHTWNSTEVWTSLGLASPLTARAAEGAAPFKKPDFSTKFPRTRQLLMRWSAAAASKTTVFCTDCSGR